MHTQPCSVVSPCSLAPEPVLPLPQALFHRLPAPLLGLSEGCCLRCLNISYALSFVLKWHWHTAACHRQRSARPLAPAHWEVIQPLDHCSVLSPALVPHPVRSVSTGNGGEGPTVSLAFSLQHIFPRASRQPCLCTWMILFFHPLSLSVLLAQPRPLFIALQYHLSRMSWLVSSDSHFSTLQAV